MIGLLRGIILYREADHCILDVEGVGYSVYVSTRLLADLPEPPEKVTLFIETAVREDAITLYGFANKSEKDWFRLLITVQGVGARMALAALSSYTLEELYTVIVSADKVSLTRISGIGPKLAARIITELKDKALVISTSSSLSVQPAKMGKVSSHTKKTETYSIQDDAVSALEGLGFKRAESYPVVIRVIAASEDELSLNDIIRASLKELGHT